MSDNLLSRLPMADDDEEFTPTARTRMLVNGETVPSMIASGTFAEMADIAFPSVVRHYKGDLYHDAVWLSQQLTLERLSTGEPFTFYWLVRDSGTHIAVDSEAARNLRGTIGHLYLVSIAETNRRWDVTFTPATFDSLPLPALTYRSKP